MMKMEKREVQRGMWWGRSEEGSCGYSRAVAYMQYDDSAAPGALHPRYVAIHVAYTRIYTHTLRASVSDDYDRLPNKL